jgi:hypothetical protein
MIPVSRQCDLLDLSRSSFYYLPTGEDEYNLMLLRLIDEQFTKTPFYGVRRMKAWLKRQGHQVNRKRIQRLMRLMGGNLGTHPLADGIKAHLFGQKRGLYGCFSTCDPTTGQRYLFSP